MAFHTKLYGRSTVAAAALTLVLGASAQATHNYAPQAEIWERCQVRIGNVIRLDPACVERNAQSLGLAQPPLGLTRPPESDLPGRDLGSPSVEPDVAAGADQAGDQDTGGDQQAGQDQTGDQDTGGDQTGDQDTGQDQQGVQDQNQNNGQDQPGTENGNGGNPELGNPGNEPGPFGPDREVGGATESPPPGSGGNEDAFGNEVRGRSDVAGPGNAGVNAGGRGR